MFVGFLLGQPNSWLQNDRILPLYIFILFLSQSHYTKQWFYTITHAPIISTILDLGWDYHLANAVSTGGIQRVLNPVHRESNIKNTVAAAIVCGVLAGTGGGILK
jgi:uncharacterized membrane-anchored protein YitT (DUF2179 family)